MTGKKAVALLALVISMVTFNVEAHAATKCPTPLAHRGVHTSTIDENSLASIRSMKGRGAAEVDLQVTKDGALVLMHDPKVDRTTNGEGFVHDLTLAQIKALKLNKSGDRVPTFREAVRVAENNGVRLVVELKEYPQWTDALFTRAGQIANQAGVRVYLGGKYQFATTVPNYANWVYWRPEGVLPTPSNAAEYRADLILDLVDNWTRKLVDNAKAAGYQTGVRLTNRFADAHRLGVGYVLTNNPAKLITYCRSL
jgi:glycerophosphoryl diester phosphodiesterase